MTTYISDLRENTETALGDLVVERSGTIRTVSTAIDVERFSSLAIFGSVYSDASAIVAKLGSQISVGSSGIVYGELTGISVEIQATVNNAGSIIARATAGVGILATGRPTMISNTGTIEATYGIRINSGTLRADNIVNTGKIVSYSGIGIELSGFGSITNDGEIVAPIGTGIKLSDAPTGRTSSVLNTGFIWAGTAIEGSAQADVVINAGTIRGWVDLGDGNDSYRGEDGWINGFVLLGSGDDQAWGGAASEVFSGGAGNDILDGGGGARDAVYFIGNTNVTVDLRITGQQQTGEGLDTIINIESVYADAGADRLIGNDLANMLEGEAGNDTLDGGLGSDTFLGGDGIDTVLFSGRTGATVNLGIGTQDTGYGIDDVSGIENVSGGSGADTLTGDGFANTLSGNGGKDRLSGGDGDDTLIGGTADDILTGGAGRDVFVFDAGRDKNVDTIKGYVVADDTIHLQNSIYTRIGSPGALASKAYWTGKKAHDPSDRVIYDKGTGALWYDADGTGSSKQIKIGQLTKNLKMSVAEFFVI